MLMKLITLDFNKHRFDLVELYVKYFTWIVEEVKKIYDIDLGAGITMTIKEFFENSINTYESYKPPDGIIYLIQVNESIMGTGSLRKYDENIGELKKLRSEHDSLLEKIMEYQIRDRDYIEVKQENFRLKKQLGFKTSSEFIFKPAED